MADEVQKDTVTVELTEDQWCFLHNAVAMYNALRENVREYLGDKEMWVDFEVQAYEELMDDKNPFMSPGF